MPLSLLVHLIKVKVKRSLFLLPLIIWDCLDLIMRVRVARDISRTAYLKVSSIMVKRTNLPRSGTTSDVGGMISASSRKNTVSDSRIEMERLT